MKAYGCSAANSVPNIDFTQQQHVAGYILSPSVYLRFYLQLHFVKAAYFSRGFCLVSTVLRPAQLCWLGQVFILQPKELPL